MSFIKALRNKNLVEATKLFKERLDARRDRHLNEEKKRIAAEWLGETDHAELLDEKMRIKIVRVRVRKGKVQRRKKVANVKGFTMRAGKLTRMSVSERRNRKLGNRRSKFKRKAKKVQMLRKRKISNMKRKRLGLK